MSSSRRAKFAPLSAWFLKSHCQSPWDQQESLWQHLDLTKYLWFKEIEDFPHPRRNEQVLEVGVLRKEHRERSCKALISNIHSASHNPRNCLLVANNAHFFSALWRQEQIEDTSNSCKGTGKRRKAPWSCSKIGNLRTGFANTHWASQTLKIYCCGQSLYFSFGRNKKGTGQELSVIPALLGVELHLPKSGNSLGAAGSFGMDQSSPGTAAHSWQLQIPPPLRLPSVSVLGNKQKTKVNSMSAGILLQETAHKEPMCPWHNRKKWHLRGTERDHKWDSPSCWVFLHLRAFCFQSCRENLKFPNQSPENSISDWILVLLCKLNLVMDLTPNILPGIETLSPGESSPRTTGIPKSGITEKGIIQSLVSESCWARVNIRNYPFINKVISVYRKPFSFTLQSTSQTIQRDFADLNNVYFFGKHPCLCYHQAKHQYLKKLLWFCLFTAEKRSQSFAVFHPLFPLWTFHTATREK